MGEPKGCLRAFVVFYLKRLLAPANGLGVVPIGQVGRPDVRHVRGFLVDFVGALEALPRLAGPPALLPGKAGVVPCLVPSRLELDDSLEQGQGSSEVLRSGLNAAGHEQGCYVAGIVPQHVVAQPRGLDWLFIHEMKSSDHPLVFRHVLPWSKSALRRSCEAPQQSPSRSTSGRRYRLPLPSVSGRSSSAGWRCARSRS